LEGCIENSTSNITQCDLQPGAVIDLGAFIITPPDLADGQVLIINCNGAMLNKASGARQVFTYDVQPAGSGASLTNDDPDVDWQHVIFRGCRSTSDMERPVSSLSLRIGVMGGRDESASTMGHSDQNDLP